MLCRSQRILHMARNCRGFRGRLRRRASTRPAADAARTRLEVLRLHGLLFVGPHLQLFRCDLNLLRRSLDGLLIFEFFATVASSHCSLLCY